MCRVGSTRMELAALNALVVERQVAVGISQRAIAQIDHSHMRCARTTMLTTRKKPTYGELRG